MSRLEQAWQRAEGRAPEEAPVADDSSAAPGHLEAYPAEQQASHGRPQLRTVPPIAEANGVQVDGSDRREVGGALHPRVSSDSTETLVIGTNVSPLLVEQYRQLAATLYEAQAEKGVRSIMISSAMPREGKTLTATNLALTLSESYHQRVLLVDADLRAPSIHELLQIPAAPGLTDYLSDTGSELPVVRFSPHLAVLPGGRMLANPIAGLVSTRMQGLMADAVTQFDWVVVDTPPIGLLPDANLVARLADAVVFVIAAGQSPFGQVQRATAQIGAERILGVVLNRAEASAVPNSSHYRRYAVT